MFSIAVSPSLMLWIANILSRGPFILLSSLQPWAYGFELWTSRVSFTGQSARAQSNLYESLGCFDWFASKKVMTQAQRLFHSVSKTFKPFRLKLTPTTVARTSGEIWGTRGAWWRGGMWLKVYRSASLVKFKKTVWKDKYAPY